MAIIKRNGNTPTLKSWLDNFWTSGSFFDDDLIMDSTLPAVNIKDNEDYYEIELAAPGLKKDEVNLSVENGVLTISGESKKEQEEKDEKFTRREFSYRSFHRSFAIPEDVNEEDIKAKYEDGLLRIRLKKTGEKAKKRKSIQVE